MQQPPSELDIRAAKILARKNLPPEERWRCMAYVGTYSHANLVLTLAWKNFWKCVKIELGLN